MVDAPANDPGDKQRAIERLRAACREALQERSNSRGLTAPGEDAQAHRELLAPGYSTDEKFLKFLSASKPVDESPGRWRLYEFNEALPMAVGLVRPAADPGPNAARCRVYRSQKTASPTLPNWGIA